MEEKFCEKCGRIHPVKRKVVCPKCGREHEIDYHDTNPLCPACRMAESHPTPEPEWKPDYSQIMTIEESLEKEKREKEKKAEVKVEVVEAQVKEEEVEEIAEKVQQGLKERLTREPEERRKPPILEEIIEETIEEKEKQLILEQKAEDMSREEQIKYLLSEIFRIRKERLLIIEEIDKQIADVMYKLREARSKLMNAGTKLEVQKWMAYIKSLTSEKTALDSRRHLVRMLHKEEARLRLELAKLETGKE